MSVPGPSAEEQAEEQQQAQQSQQLQQQLQAKLAAEQEKKEAEDRRVQAQKVKTLRIQSTGGGGGLFSSGNQTLG